MRILLPIILLCFLLSCKQESGSNDLVRLKLTNMDGFGPFPQMFSVLDWKPLSENAIWAKTEVETTGVPKSWVYSNVLQVKFDSHQFAYQNYKQGNLSEEIFNKLKETWDIDFGKRKLSVNPINCFVHVAIGANATGKLQYVIDTNHNNDFSDEKIMVPEQMGSDLNFNKAIEDSQSVIAEISTMDGIRKKEVKILILSNGRGNLIYNIPEIAKTEFLGTEILVSNGFSNITYDDFAMIAINDENPQVLKRNELIQIENSLYKNLGVDINTNELQLLKISRDTIIYSSTIGSKARPFTVKQFDSRDSLKLSDFKGKFLYLEFWGTWCAPCIEEIPNLKRAYNATNRKEIEFLGVAVSDTKEKLNNAIKKYDLSWPQVLETDAYQFKENYNVTSYPTSFLIDKKGKIIAKNLKGDQLFDTLNYYTSKIK
ncbi:TlpA family protein disulfide reductase [Winogradskyella sp. HB-48]|uniref:TlpA family protein disulfide reductase n=1 Tax=Winogradskyella sp. HB-48 TaxID=3416808 RepID=UPI003CEE0C2F